MNAIDVLLSGAVLMALAAYTVLSLVIEGTGLWLLHRTQDNVTLHRMVKHLALPLARATMVVMFILLSYPTLFGIAHAPALGALMADDKGHFSSLIDAVFLVSLLLPLLPLIGRLPALVLPVQGIAAATLLFSWLADTPATVAVHYWPGAGSAALMLALAIAGHEIAKHTAHALGETLDDRLHVHGSGSLVYSVIVLVLQAPVILIYTLGLGRQLAGQ